jgi:hypothetical protein
MGIESEKGARKRVKMGKTLASRRIKIYRKGNFST